MHIVERQTVIVYADLTGPIQSFSYDLDLQFEADHVVVRDVTYSAGGVLGIHGIIADFCRAKNNVIAVFDDADPTPYHSNPDSTYRISHSSSTLSNGQITFRIRKLANNGGVSSSLAVGDLCFTLEFQKHEYERKPEEIILQSIDKILAKHIINQPQVYPFQLPNQIGQGSQQFIDPSTEVIPDVHPEEKVETVQEVLPQGVIPDVHPEEKDKK